MKRIIKTASAAAVTTAVALFSVIAYYNITLPDSFYVAEGDTLSMQTQLNIEAKTNAHVPATQASVTMQNNETVSLSLFGIIPIKDVKVETVDRPQLVPGGTPFGIKMLTEGVVVIGLADIDSKDGSISPSKEAGIKIGDIILSVDGKEVASNNDIADIIENTDGNPISIKVRRGEKEHTLELTPVCSVSSGCYKAGIWVRDSSAGIGTVTYYDASTGAFAGLGHPVCDVDTGEILPLSSGEVVAVAIGGVTKGETGNPGELSGSFVSKTPIGKLLLNGETGIFGTLNNAPNDNAPIPMAMRQEVVTGPAKILATISGNEAEEYDVMIEKIDLKDDAITKNMVVKVVDPKLLSITGGIVQGMSGSPIIQNGRLIGAVTHVFVNDPTKGYGIFCENMYNFSKDIANEAA